MYLSDIVLLGLKIRAPNLRFFWFGLRLRYIMVCDVTLVCVQVRSVKLIKELEEGAGRNRSHRAKKLIKYNCSFKIKRVISKPKELLAH